MKVDKERNEQVCHWYCYCFSWKERRCVAMELSFRVLSAMQSSLTHLSTTSRLQSRRSVLCDESDFDCRLVDQSLALGDY